MKKRGQISRLSELLPEVLIQAQGCDEITARASLRRQYEMLCQSHGFGHSRVWIVVNESDDNENEMGAMEIPFDGDELLCINSVSFKLKGEMRNVGNYEVVDGVLYIARDELPSDLSNDGHGLSICIDLEMMPPVDGDISECRFINKWRNLILYFTLADLFSQSRQPWFDKAGYEKNIDLANRTLEDFCIKEQYLKQDTRSRTAMRPQYENIFC